MSCYVLFVVYVCIYIYIHIHDYIWVHMSIYDHMDPADQPTHHPVVLPHPAGFCCSEKNMFSTTSLQILYKCSAKVQPFTLLVHTKCNLDNGMLEPHQLGYGRSGIKPDECQTQKSPMG